jgi:hypothetical protein
MRKTLGVTLLLLSRNCSSGRGIVSQPPFPAQA